MKKENYSKNILERYKLDEGENIVLREGSMSDEERTLLNKLVEIDMKGETLLNELKELVEKRNSVFSYLELRTKELHPDLALDHRKSENIKWGYRIDELREFCVVMYREKQSDMANALSMFISKLRGISDNGAGENNG